MKDIRPLHQRLSEFHEWKSDLDDLLWLTDLPVDLTGRALAVLERDPEIDAELRQLRETRELLAASPSGCILAVLMRHHRAQVIKAIARAGT